MANQCVHFLIFTDLDGTLLDHHSYSAKPADHLVRQLRDQSMADIIPITSKTRSELQALEQSIPISGAVSVTENGSVIHAPDGAPFAQDEHSHIVIMGVEYGRILDQVNGLPQHLRQHITGFADMSVQAVAEATGLPIEDAQRAKEREATEPFLWSGSDAAYSELEAAMAKADIRIQRGGRFYHFTGQATKEQAMKTVVRAFQSSRPELELVSIALGDGPNDLGMIEAADIGVIMPNVDGVAIISTKSHVRTAAGPGPHGWVAAIQDILQKYGLTLPET
ncbi:HAD-IIB family hydrolase [Parasphingorhabdus cellanae]|uniref:HAD-IIB family hydrolase n=1 Tax=Parasphingorhabdus cellanae TaxID=2806553 RepID=A0ABX7T7M9_9SPHN|nr:HAD-IIB family hydrolase [Parasphingorhabdus cellanae]QTD57621.1 HAD-IIB family hydrolase [Parasphingorhabdus cellanae]